MKLTMKLNYLVTALAALSLAKATARLRDDDPRIIGEARHDTSRF
jgi:hypothetical protein